MRRTIAVVTLTALMTVCSVAGLCQKGKKPQPKKPPAKPPVTKPAPGIIGAAMLPGDNGKLNQAYMLGTTDDHLVFTLTGAEFTKGRFINGDNHEVPTKEQKLLLLTFTIQNNNNREMLCRFDTIKMTAVDSKDVNHEWIGDIVKLGENKSRFDANLKPAQKVTLQSGVMVPADVSVPKLMVQQHADSRVLRYDLRGQIKPLPAPFADTSDSTGAKALGDVPAQVGQSYPLAAFDVQVDSAAFTTETLGDEAVAEGNRLLVVKLTFHNVTNTKHLLRFDSIDAELKTADGDKIGRRSGALYKAARNEGADLQVDPGDTYTGRIAFELPKDLAPGKLYVWEGESHRLVYDLSNMK